MSSISQKKCAFETCNRVSISLGYCNAHYLQYRKGKELKPTRDPSNFGEWGVWTTTSKGYKVRHKYDRNKTTSQYQHRYVMQEFLGRELLPEENVHHKNGDRSDNRLENLELWSRSQPYGQRVDDKIQWMTEFLAVYGYSVVETSTTSRSRLRNLIRKMYSYFRRN